MLLFSHYIASNSSVMTSLFCDCSPPISSVHVISQATRVGCHFLLQGIFLTQRLNLCLLHGQADSLPMNHHRLTYTHCYIWNRWASLVTQGLKHLPPMRETWVWSLGQEDPLEKEMATCSSILAWRIPWMEEPGRLQSTGSQRVRHDWATSLTHSLTHSLTYYIAQGAILNIL